MRFPGLPRGVANLAFVDSTGRSRSREIDTRADDTGPVEIPVE